MCMRSCFIHLFHFARRLASQRDRNPYALVAELKECCRSADLQRGKIIHQTATETGYDRDVFVANTIIDMYGKCGCVADARRVFEKMPAPTVVSWTALIMGYADNGESETALELFSRMGHQGRIAPNALTFVAGFKACITEKKNKVAFQERGRALHRLAQSFECDSHVYVRNTMIDMYSKLGCMEDAWKVFQGLQDRTVVSWTTLLIGFVDNNQAEKTLELFCRMRSENCEPNERTFVAAVKACVDLTTKEDISGTAEVVHLQASRCGCDSSVHLSNALVGLYMKCGNVEHAQKTFDLIKMPSLVSWNTLMLGYADNGDGITALHLFSKMKELCLNSISFLAAVKACSDIGSKERTLQGKENVVHLLASRAGCDSNEYVSNALVKMYATFGLQGEAHRIFHEMEIQTVVSWNALISGYVENGEAETALRLLSTMGLQGSAPDSITLLAGLRACIDSNLRQTGAVIHLIASRTGCDSNLYLQNMLVEMYAKFGNLDGAWSVFQSIHEQTVVSWTALIWGYLEIGQPEVALELFAQMGSNCCEPNARTIVAVLKVSTELVMKDKIARTLFNTRGTRAICMLASRIGCDSDVYMQNTLLDVHTKCGSMDDACKVFEGMQRTVVSWNTLMVRYAENGEGRMVLELYQRMKLEGCEPDCISFLAMIKACGLLGDLEEGKKIHSQINATLGFGKSLFLVSALVDFYAKCGAMVDAEHVLLSCNAGRDLETLNALMAGYSRHGDTRNVFGVFDRIVEAGLKPNGVTFLCVLSACSHAGLVEKGRYYFQMLSKKYNCDIAAEHYTCMVDLLGRANKLDEAMVLARNIPFQPDSITWMTVLGACRKWNNVALARLAFESFTSIQNDYSGAYVMMANMEADSCFTVGS